MNRAAKLDGAFAIKSTKKWSLAKNRSKRSNDVADTSFGDAARIWEKTLWYEEHYTKRSKGCVSLSRGYLDTREFPLAANLGVSASAEHRIHSNYQMRLGNIDVRRDIADYENDFSDFELNENKHIALVAGGLSGVQQSLDAAKMLKSHAQEIIVPLPSYGDLVAQASRFGKPVLPLCDAADNFLPTAKLVQRCVSDKTIAVLITNPGNPVGRYVREKDLQEIVKLAERYQFFVILDETGDNFRRPLEAPFRSKASATLFSPNVIRIRSFSKEFGLAGLRVGYIVTSAPIMDRLKISAIGNPPTILNPFIRPLLHRNSETENRYHQLRKRMETRWIQFSAALDRIPRLKYVNPEASYNVLCSVDLEIGCDKFFDACLGLGVSIYPGTAFGFSNDSCHFRLTFANAENRNLKGLKKLKACIESY